MFKVGQIAVSKTEDLKFQIRRIRVFNGDIQLGLGKKSIAWVFAKDFEKYKKVTK